MKRRASERLATGAAALLARLAIAVAALVMALGVCECAARLLLPPRQVVEVEPIPALAAAEGPVRTAEQSRGIDVLLDWTGHHGVRLHPNMRATIRAHRLSGLDVVVETNGLGLRHPPLEPPSLHETRILVFGDSITLADYAPLEGAFPALLEERLTTGDRPVSVVNAGLPGVSTADELALYLEIRDAVAPDVVLLAMYLNDAQNSNRFYAREVAPWLRWSRLAGWGVGRFDLLRQRFTVAAVNSKIDRGWRERFRAGRRLGTGNMYHDQDAFDFEIYNASTDFGLGWNPAAWTALGRLVAAFANETDRRGERFGALLLPVHIQVLGSVNDRFPQLQFQAMCDRLRLPCLDLLPALRAAHSNGNREVFYDHCHLTPVGNRAVADAIAEWLPGTGLVTAD